MAEPSTLHRSTGSLDEELRALGLIESIGVRDRLVRELRHLGATPLQVRRVHPLIALLVYLNPRVYVISGPSGTSAFVKFAVERYPRAIPDVGWKKREELARRGLPVDEVAVFDDLALDPYLAVRVGEEWYALHHWDVPAPTPYAGGWRLPER